MNKTELTNFFEDILNINSDDLKKAVKDKYEEKLIDRLFHFFYDVKTGYKHKDFMQKEYKNQHAKYEKLKPLLDEVIGKQISKLGETK